MSEPTSQISGQSPDLEKLYKEAQQARPLLQGKADAILEVLRKKHPGVFDNVTFELADLKEFEKAQRKIDVRYNGDTTKITDLVRGRYVVENTEQLKILEDALKNDPDVAKVVNRFEKPVNNTGYRNMSSEVTLSNGHVAELQVVHRDMMRVDKYMHTQMDRIREIRHEAKGRDLTSVEKKEIKNIEKEMREVNRAAAHDARDPRLNDIVDPDLRAKHVYKGEMKNGNALDAVFEKIQSKPAAALDNPASVAARKASTEALREGIIANPVPSGKSPVVEGTSSGKTKTPDVSIKVPNKAVNLTDDAAELAAKGSGFIKAARGLKLTKLGIVTGVAVTGAIAVLIHKAHESQRDAAGSLLKSGKISQDVHDEYIELNHDVEKMMQSENIAGQGWAFLITTPAVEAKAAAMFSKFSEKHNLSPEIHKMLGMSLFDSKSTIGKFADATMDAVPLKKEDMPEGMHALIDAKKEVKKANAMVGRAAMGHRGGGDMSVPEAKENLARVQEKYNVELRKAFSDPESAKILIDRIPEKAMLNMTVAMARGTQEDPSAHPLIRQLGEFQNKLDSLDGKKGSEADAQREHYEKRVEQVKELLSNNPEIIKNHVLQQMNKKTPDKPQTLEYKTNKIEPTLREAKAVDPGTTEKSPSQTVAQNDLGGVDGTAYTTQVALTSEKPEFSFEQGLTVAGNRPPFIFQEAADPPTENISLVSATTPVEIPMQYNPAQVQNDDVNSSRSLT